MGPCRQQAGSCLSLPVRAEPLLWGDVLPCECGGLGVRRGARYTVSAKPRVPPAGIVEPVGGMCPARGVRAVGGLSRPDWVSHPPRAPQRVSKPAARTPRRGVGAA